MDKTEMVKYCNSLEEIKQRLAAIQKITRNGITIKNLGREDFDMEFVAIQLRKVLELICLLSLIANKKAYSKAQEKFAEHWNAKLILKDLERVNPNYYPVPLYFAGLNKEGNKHFEKLESGFLSKVDLLFLYNKCSKALHAMNPYSNSTTINFKKSIDDWVQSIIQLLSLHHIILVGTENTWLVQLNSSEDNKAHVLATTPVSKEDYDAAHS